ncbi:hypothetical protein N7528_005470 [Penicillium herquei]|nr:hypothetical protein N7528_005470 [Penicillium herquei]
MAIGVNRGVCDRLSNPGRGHRTTKSMLQEDLRGTATMLRLDSPTPDEVRIHGPKFDEDGVVVEMIHGDPDTAIMHTQTVDENQKDSSRDDSARENEGGPTDDEDGSGEEAVNFSDDYASL